MAADAEAYDDTYTESQVILTTVRAIAPFTMTYGFFLTLHGADTPGGSFQGGAIVGVTILMLAFAFGIEPTREWLRNSVLVVLVTGGVAIFVGVGLAAVALGGNFLEYEQFETALGIAPKWGMEAIEIGGISLIVAGVVITLFFATAAGYPPEKREGGTPADGGETGANSDPDPGSDPAPRTDGGSGAGDGLGSGSDASPENERDEAVGADPDRPREVDR